MGGAQVVEVARLEVSDRDPEKSGRRVVQQRASDTSGWAENGLGPPDPVRLLRFAVGRPIAVTSPGPSTTTEAPGSRVAGPCRCL